MCSSLRQYCTWELIRLYAKAAGIAARAFGKDDVGWCLKTLNGSITPYSRGAVQCHVDRRAIPAGSSCAGTSSVRRIRYCAAGTPPGDISRSGCRKASYPFRARSSETGPCHKGGRTQSPCTSLPRARQGRSWPMPGARSGPERRSAAGLLAATNVARLAEAS